MRWRSHYLLFLEFAVWSSSNSPRLHVQKVAAPRRPHGAAPWVPPLSTALPRSSPTWLCLWTRLGHFACFYPQAESAAGSRATEPLVLVLCRANKSWHPVDHYWQPCMRWDEAREESGPFIVYLFHSHRGSWRGWGVFTCILDSSPAVTCSETVHEINTTVSHIKSFFSSTFWLCSFCPVIVPSELHVLYLIVSGFFQSASSHLCLPTLPQSRRGSVWRTRMWFCVHSSLQTNRLPLALHAKPSQIFKFLLSPSIWALRGALLQDSHLNSKAAWNWNTTAEM